MRNDVGDLPAIEPVAADVKWTFAEKQRGSVTPKSVAFGLTTVAGE